MVIEEQLFCQNMFKHRKYMLNFYAGKTLKNVKHFLCFMFMILWLEFCCHDYSRRGLIKLGFVSLFLLKNLLSFITIYNVIKEYII